MRIPRVALTLRLPPGNARWFALSVGVLVLSVGIAVVVSTLGWISDESAAGRTVEAEVVTGRPCVGSGGTEAVRFTVDGLEREARFDGCGHSPGERVTAMVGSGPVVHAADAAAGQGRFGRRLGELLLVLAGVAGAAYGLLVQRGPRGTPLHLLGRFESRFLRPRPRDRPLT